MVGLTMLFKFACDMLPFCATFAVGGPAGESLLLCWGTMDIPPLELPFVVGREAATPALPGGWPDMGGGKLRSEGSQISTGKMA